MATYTIKIREIIDFYGREEVESWFKDYELEEYLTEEQIATIINAGIWNKNKLARKIVDHYYMREIGFETPGLFANRVKARMQEIMEDYLPVIYSNAIKFDPLVNVDFTETFERSIESESHNNGSSSSNSNSNSSGLNVNSDTPQGQISKTDILQGAYASSTSASESESHVQDGTTTENSGTGNQNENYTKKTKGNSGVSATAQALIKQYRDIIRAVDREIIEELNDMFMGIY
ncbi:MAG: hypothetical protein IKU37_09035 [Candidatus Gastranaerophilales bacterium]|nr:hypothetical protein [Candidatus Gastranaerophilales bacterium]